MYILGDIHGELFSLVKFWSNPDEQFCIQLGDWGFWFSNEETPDENNTIDFIERHLTEKDKFIFTILGNHDCWPRYFNLPTVKKCSAKCWQIRPHIYAVQKGEILMIEEKRCLCIGGADSIDKDWRLTYEREHNEKIWWKEETIGEDAIENAEKNLSKFNGKVDYVFTHSSPGFAVQKLFTNPTISSSERRLDDLFGNIQFNCWYCGHLHTSQVLNKHEKELRILGINEVHII